MSLPVSRRVTLTPDERILLLGLLSEYIIDCGRCAKNPSTPTGAAFEMLENMREASRLENKLRDNT